MKQRIKRLSPDTEQKSYLFGAITYERVGGVSLTKAFGIRVFERVGDVGALFGVVWVCPAGRW